MSELQKYRCYGKDDFGNPYDALSLKDQYGEWYLAEDVDARLAADAARIEMLESAVEWINENAELSSNEDGVHLTVLDASKQYRQWLKVPDQFAAIIKPAREE